MENDSMTMRKIARLRPVAVAASIALATGALFVIGPAVPASAQGPVQPSGSGGSAALISPLLELLDFGAAVGLPEGCNTATSVINTGAAEFNATSQVAAVLTAIAAACDRMKQAGEQQVQQAIARSQSLTFINPVLNPPIAGLASALQTLGGQYGSALAPFGPTIAGLGQTVTFFEGS
jgi:hypothetical protein